MTQGQDYEQANANQTDWDLLAYLPNNYATRFTLCKFFIIQLGKARAMPCPYQPPTRGDNIVSVAQAYIYIYIYIYICVCVCVCVCACVCVLVCVRAYVRVDVSLQFLSVIVWQESIQLFSIKGKIVYLEQLQLDLFQNINFGILTTYPSVGPLFKNILYNLLHRFLSASLSRSLKPEIFVATRNLGLWNKRKLQGVKSGKYCRSLWCLCFVKTINKKKKI